MTTDPQDEGRLREVDGHRWVDEQTPDGVAVFTEMAVVDLGGVDPEAFGVVRMALDRQGPNGGFLRETSSLCVIVIADEDDSTPGLDPAEFSSWLLALGAGRPHATLSAIVPTSGPGAAQRFFEVVTATGGAFLDIDEPMWAPLMLELPFERLSGRFCLATAPDPDSVEVTMDGAAVEGWTLDGSCVELPDVPAPGSEVVITYLPA